MQNELESPNLVIVGIGETGLAVVDHLYNVDIKNVRLVIGHTNADHLRASPVPDRFLFDATQTDEDAKWHLINALNDMKLISELTVVVADLSDPTDCRFASLLVQVLIKQGAFTIVTIGLPTYADPAQRERADRTLRDLQHRANTLWVHKLEQADLQHRIEQLADAVGKLTKFCESLVGNADFADVKRVVNNTRIAVATATSQGDNRAVDIVNSLISQLQAQLPDRPGFDHILLIMSSSDEKPLKLREQTSIFSGVNDFNSREAQIIKTGLISNYWLGEWLDCALLVGTHVNR